MKMKKTLAVLLALTMCLSLLPMSAFAYGDNNEKLEIVVGFVDSDLPTANLPTLNLTTTSDDVLTLTMPKGTVAADDYDNVTVAVKRWEDGSTPVLDYPQTYDGGNDDLKFGNLLNEFHAFCAGGPNNLTVTWRDGGEQVSADYILRGVEDGVKSTFIAEPNDGNASTVWGKITDDANRSLTTKSNTDSYIVLAADSYFEMYGGKISVIEKFKLDNFDDLDSIADEYRAKTAFDYVEETNAFEVALKKGTTLAVGTDLITLLRDVKITLNGDTHFADYLEHSLTALESVDNDIRNETTVNGTRIAQDLVDYINGLFGAIAVHTEGFLELAFVFDGAATEASIIGEGEQVDQASATAAIAEAAEGNVYVAQGDNVTLGSATGAAKITVKEKTAIVVESSAAEIGTEQTANTSEITYTPVGETEPQTAYVVSTSSTTSAATVALVAEKFTVDTATVNDGNDETKPTSYVDLTQVITSIAADATDADMEQIATVDTTWTLKLDDTEPVTPAVVDSAVVAKYGEVANKDTSVASVYVDVQPVMTVTETTDSTNVISTYRVPSDQLAAGAKFQYTIEGLMAGKTYHIYHKCTDGVEDLGVEIANSEGKVPIELTSFSPIVAVPLTTPAPGSADAEIVSMNAYLGEFFILNLYVKTAEANPTFSFERTDYKPYTLLQSTDKSEFVNDIKATYYVEEITTYDPEKNALDITNAYHGKDMESGYHYYMVSVKLYTAFLDKNVIMSMKTNSGADMTIRDYYEPIYGLGSNTVAATQAHSFVDYLGMMNTYYTGKGDTTTADYYNDLYTGLTAAAAAARVVAPPAS